MGVEEVATRTSCERVVMLATTAFRIKTILAEPVSSMRNGFGSDLLTIRSVSKGREAVDPEIWEAARRKRAREGVAGRIVRGGTSHQEPEEERNGRGEVI